MKYLASALFAAVVAANGCGEKRRDTLPDPGPGTCNDVAKCCDWTWPPPLTAVVSCDSTVPGSCYNCKAPDCCCQSGGMMIGRDGKIHVSSCCDYFYSDGTICDDIPENC